MAFLNSLGSGVTNLAVCVEGAPEDGQSSKEAEQGTNLEDLSHGETVDMQQDGAHSKVHGHTQEGHDTCPVLFRDRLSPQCSNGGEVHAGGELEQEERQDGVGAAVGVKNDKAERCSCHVQCARQKLVRENVPVGEEFEGERSQHAAEHHG